MKFFKIALKFVIFTLLAVLLFLIGSNIWVIGLSKSMVFEHAEGLSNTDVALVLGTSKKFASGQPNQFFGFRMDAAAQLFHEGKVKHLILSGDNNTIYYNEPMDMKKALLERGVTDEKITLDYAGFRTFDSIVRCKEVFGQNKFTIVTQKFHSYRAVFIAKYYGLDVQAYAAQNMSAKQSFKVQFREFLARPKAVLDLYFLKQSPKFLGDPEIILFEESI